MLLGRSASHMFVRKSCSVSMSGAYYCSFVTLASSSSRPQGFSMLTRRHFGARGQLDDALGSGSSSTLPIQVPDRMKAAVLTRIRQDTDGGGPTDNEGPLLQVEEVMTPTPGPGEVLLQVVSCGVCHSDLHVMKRGGLPLPSILGHEIAGRLVAFGKGVQRQIEATVRPGAEDGRYLSLGARVCTSFVMPCGSCSSCAQGRDDLCEPFFSESRAKGVLYDGESRLFRPDGTALSAFSMGGLAEYAVVPWQAVFPYWDDASGVPDGTIQDRHTSAWSHNAILGCAVFTGYGAVAHTAQVRAGESVAVVGCGGVGASAIQVAAAFGAGRIFALDVADDKLELMQSLGATHTINVSGLDPEQIGTLIREELGHDGRGGVDVAIEALGRSATWAIAVDIVRAAGRVVAVGLSPDEASVPIASVVRRQVQILGGYGGRSRQDMPRVMNLASRGILDIESSVTNVYSGLEQADQAYADLASGKILGRGVIQISSA